MKKVLILLFAVCLFSCKQKDILRHKYNPEAVRLSNLALDTLNKMPGLNREQNLAFVIGLLDKAISIDSTYYFAYSDKMSYQVELKDYKGAIITGKQLIKIGPKDIDYYTLIGIIYEEMGDSISSRPYFANGLLLWNRILDTMSVNNKKYKFCQADKAIDLILLGQEQKGNIILKQLYNAETDTDYRQMYLLYMNKSKKELFNGFTGTAKPIGAN